MYLAYAVIFVGVVFGTVHDSRGCASCASPVPVAAIFGAILVVIIVWCERVAIKTGLEESDDGFVIRRNFGSSSLRVVDVDRFGHTDAAIKAVYAVRRNGKTVPIPGLAEGRRVIWDGGESREIVSVLNERLEARREAGA